MDSAQGRFHEVEKDGKVIELVYHHPKYDLISKTQSLNSPVQDHIFQFPFLCPYVRISKEILNLTRPTDDTLIFPIVSSPINKHNALSTTNSENHHLLPLFWCNNKEIDDDDDDNCASCFGSKWGKDYYLCESCGVQYHKECVESPPQIRHPYHPKQSLQLYYNSDSKERECYCCKRIANYLVYGCTICEIFMHTVCAMNSITFVIDPPPKRHDHPLVFFTRKSPLTCNVCGLMRESNHTYICVRCNFVSHKDCMYSPHIIKISRHPHRISHISFLSSGGRCCGVCHQNINGDYGAYACDKCDNYVVHSTCALVKDVWDGQDLKDIPEEDDITQDVGPFDIISEGVISHFLHEHHLSLKVNMNYDENKFCQACALPIFEGNIYFCENCDYILHETCANAPRRIQHAMHLHTLKLKKLHKYDYSFCSACRRCFSGFVYECEKGNCRFYLDIKCALIPEQFMYHGHEHPLFLGLEQAKNPICHVCDEECLKHFKCIEYSTCNYIVCIKCATIPYRMRCKHDEHFLTLSCENNVSEGDCCEVCEYNLKDSSTKGFYWCKECCTTFHIDCLFSEDSYLKVGSYLKYGNQIHFQILKRKESSRPFCVFCSERCQSTIVRDENGLIFCSMKCLSG